MDLIIKIHYNALEKSKYYLAIFKIFTPPKFHYYFKTSYWK